MKPINTLFVGQVFHEYQNLASTNEFAINLLSKSKPSEGTVILTPNQSDGRGQIGSSWESAPEKNLTLSVILYPHFLPARHQFDLNIVVSLAVFATVKTYIPTGVKVKWANDIYVGKNKISGILIQNALLGRSIQNSVIGIGLNVNQLCFESDAPNPTSLGIECAKSFDLEEVRATLFQKLEQYYLQLRAGKSDELKEEYLSNLYQFGEEKKYTRADGSCFTGKIIGISEVGKLQIQQDHLIEEFALKEVRFEK